MITKTITFDITNYEYEITVSKLCNVKDVDDAAGCHNIERNVS